MTLLREILKNKLKLFQLEMARFNILPFLLALFLFANFVDFSLAAEDDNYSDVPQFSASSDWENKECTVVNAKAPKYYLYMKGFWKGRFVSYKRFNEPDKSTRWIINPVQRDGNVYFEMKNLDGDTFIAPFQRKNVAGNFRNFAKSSNIETLWKFNPPKQGVEISIESSSKNLFMNKPSDSSSRNVVLSKTKKTAWIIKCD